ncbi:cytochrome C peroxidase [Candidatus Binatia bacterium]|nr:cytochrome C peroxidase [Candidatus Binatia bacterium]
MGGHVAAADDPPRPPSLKTIVVPEPTNLADFVRDRTAAIALGKALFWDMQIGSDGVQACASCHFHAGADSRSRNQLSPGLRRVHADGTADPDAAFAPPRAVNRQLTADDFPLPPGTNDVVGSQGLPLLEFGGLAHDGSERLVALPDPDGFRAAGLDVRRVTSRNAPSVINAVFNDRNFWDGRAARTFNGVNGLGDGDPDARVYRADDPRRPVPVAVRLAPASLASQALLPPLSDVEMSGQGRTFPEIAAKLARGTRDTERRVRRLRPLAKQLVAPGDSVLGRLSAWPRPGLRVKRYEQLIRKAFAPRWWRSPKLIRVLADGTTEVVDRRDGRPETAEYTLLQHNFALFFGLAIQLYEATLVADDSPWDRFMDGDRDAISPLAIEGADVFRSQTRGRCINCHEGAELTGASVRRVAESPTRIREGQALDRGFNNVGVVATREDPGVGGRDALGRWLSSVRRLDPPPAEPIAVDGAMKVPGLRNVELTAPYFHSGGLLTLRQVLDFYSRGGDVRPQHTLDGALEIAPLNVLGNTEHELDALEAFLRALTDERVRLRRAPFDHPQLFVPDGHGDDELDLRDDGRGIAVDRLREIAAVGRDGGPPLPRFLE